MRKSFNLNHVFQQNSQGQNGLSNLENLGGEACRAGGHKLLLACCILKRIEFNLVSVSYCS